MNKCIDCYYYTDRNEEITILKVTRTGYNIPTVGTERQQLCHYDNVAIGIKPNNYCKGWKANNEITNSLEMAMVESGFVPIEAVMEEFDWDKIVEEKIIPLLNKYASKGETD